MDVADGHCFTWPLVPGRLEGEADFGMTVAGAIETRREADLLFQDFGIGVCVGLFEKCAICFGREEFDQGTVNDGGQTARAAFEEDDFGVGWYDRAGGYWVGLIKPFNDFMAVGDDQVDGFGAWAGIGRHSI